MYLNFQNVILYYYENEKCLNLPDRNLQPIREWLKNELKLDNGKDNTKSIHIRKQGNVFYKNKSLKKSLQLYNSSICYAPVSSEEYFLALANRSAVTFEMGKYEDCLKDIELCLSSSTYPKNLKPKLQARKNECMRNLYIDELNKLNTSSNVGEILNNLPIHVVNQEKNFMYKLPSFEIGENPNFAYASSKIGKQYNKHKGRHVVAKECIKKGDILFLEKAFTFGTIFDEHSRTTNMLKCYYCLKNTYRGNPCNYCAKCIFCDEYCKNKSWEESHRWECHGMVGDVWYHLGIAFPAFRALLKGVDCIYEEIQVDSKCFGNKENNYPYFNSLVFDKNNKHLDVYIMSATVATYLKEYTSYFSWFLSQTKNASWNMEKLVNFFENQLSKHILQFQNNSSIIEHWLDDGALPINKEPVACGIFPSVSIMNHSCKPNITNYFICDTIVVTALEDIKENDEIVNCYGIYYRDMNKEERQSTCFQLYQFQCNCVICSNPSNEMDAYDLFLCQNCGKNITIIDDGSTILCCNCGIKMDYKILMDMSQCIDLEEDENDLKSLKQALDRRKKLLSRYHSHLQNNYFKLYNLNKEKGNYECMLNYFEEWFEVEKKKVGQDIQLFGFLLHEIGSILISTFSTSANENKKILQKAQNFIAEARVICSYHYPPQIAGRI